MTERTPEAGAQVEVADIVAKIGETIQSEANVRAVFGQPVQLDSKTFVPVAVVSVSFGGGVGGARIFTKAMEDRVGAAPFGGGAGLSVAALPVGFLSEKDGAIVFTPIDVRDESGDEIAHGMLGRLLHRVQQAAG